MELAVVTEVVVAVTLAWYLSRCPEYGDVDDSEWCVCEVPLADVSADDEVGA